MLPYMVQLARFVRSVFGTEALLALLAAASWTWRIEPESLGGWLVLPIMFAVFATFSLVNGMAWWTLRKGKPTARGWAIAASILNLPLFPLGTAIGIAGLWVFLKPDLVAKTAGSSSAAPI